MPHLTVSGRPTPKYGLALGERHYDVRIHYGPQLKEVKLRESVSANDKQYIVESTVLGDDQAFQDRVVLDRQGLHPVQREARQQDAVISMAYHEDGTIEGVRAMNSKNESFTLKGSERLFSDGAAEGIAIAALDLAPGYFAHIQRFDVYTQRIETYKLFVQSLQVYSVPAIRTEAFEVIVESISNPLDQCIFYLEARGQRRVLRIEGILPAAGGARYEQTLIR